MNVPRSDQGAAEAAAAERPTAAVLIVDDTASKRLALRAMLAPLGHTLVEVDSGRAALRAVLHQTFAVILMDVRMPGLDGYETAKLIRQRSSVATTPIIFVTGFGRDETETATAYASGAVDFIFTPILPDVVRAKISVFVDLFVQSQELQGSLESITALNASLRDRERASRHEARRERAAFDEAPIGSVIAGRDGKIERVNQAMCSMTGYTADELVGTHFLELTDRVDSEPVHHARRVHDSATVVSAVLDNGSGTQRFEKHWVLRNGRVFDGRVAVTAICNDAQEVTQLFAQIEDVTDARRTSRELEQAQFEMLARLAAAAEYRDDDTGQHTRRVGDLSVAIAARLGLPQAQVELIRFAAPLHDIGKIAIPDAVLGKPGKLTDEEFGQMKTHTTIGAQMLAGSTFALLELAEQIALTHHEKWDGRGYPDGLIGDAIPIAGRIVAVADVFDALTHARPYKAAWSTEDAIAELTNQAGRHFDPEVVDAFLAPRREARPAPSKRLVSRAPTPVSAVIGNGHRLEPRGRAHG